MAWKQTLWPNLDDNPNNPLYVWIGGKIIDNWCGWCLAVVAASYSAKGSSYSAKTAWQANNTKHRDRNLPEGIYVPIWYEGGEFGHVAIALRKGNNLTVWSSPCGKNMATFQVFSGEINWLLDYLGSGFLVGSFSGWTETVLDSRVIEKVTESKPEPKPEPEPEPEPEPTPEPDDPKDDNDGKDNDMANPEPVQGIDQQLAGGIIEEASSLFDFSDKTKLIAYIIGDTLLVGAILVPDIINAIQAPTLSIFGEYLAKVLLEAGTCILMVFKLIKKKS